MIAFIRGLPGSGKTTISDVVSKKLGWDVVHVDEFKKELMQKNPEANFVTEIVPASYKLALAKLDEYKTRNVIFEEIFRNKAFVEQILEFCEKNAVENRWFKIVRARESLLEINDTRTRKIKNSPELLDMFEEQMNSIVIGGELEVPNQDLEEAVNSIYSKLAL